MVRSYNLVSADSHVNPLPTFWRDYLPRKFREVAPMLEHTDEGDFLVFEGKRRPFTIIGSLAGKDPKDFKVTGRVSETRQGGWDPIHRILDLDIDGVDAEILYGGGPLTTRDPDLFAASFPAYNSWLGDFCNFESGRLLGIGYIPMMDQEAAVEEVKRIAKNGLRGIVIPPFPPSGNPNGLHVGGAIMQGDPDSGRTYADPEFERFWDTTIGLGLPVHVHLGARRSETRPEKFLPSMVMTKISMAEIIAQFIFWGMLEKHPELKLVSVESSIGWFPFVAQYMDKIWEKHRYWTHSTIREKPSFYMERQVYGTFLEDPVGVAMRHVPGAGNIMWSSDYPHSETTWPESRKVVDEQFKDLPDDEKHEIICGIAAKLYNIAD